MGILMLNGNNYTGGIQQVYGSSSGAIASFDDGGNDKPLKSLKVAINPVQDLHGYDSPWVGGAGKNKLPLVLADIKSLNTAGTWSENVYTYKNVSYSILTDNGNNITGLGISGTNTERSDLLLPPPLLSGLSNIAFSARFISGSPVRPLRFQIYGGTGTARDRYINADPTEATWNVDGEYTAAVLNVYGGSGDIAITLQIEEGSTATSFAPYSNICPISGWDEAEIHRADGATPHIIDDTYNITWSEAGTVYGGKLHVTTGELTVTDGYIASYNGETLPSTWISDRDVYTPNTSPTTGAEVVYKLATPTKVTLTPTEVDSLLGNNNIWSDTGEIEECVYQRDLNLVINQFDARITALEQAMASLSGTRSLSLSKSAPIEEPKEEETNEEITEEPKEEEQNEDKR